MRSMLHRNTITHSRPMAGATGLEPATSGVTGRRSNQLSYAPKGSTEGRTPTPSSGGCQENTRAEADQSFAGNSMATRPAGQIEDRNWHPAYINANPDLRSAMCFKVLNL
jgi:hypothetical protein